MVYSTMDNSEERPDHDDCAVIEDSPQNGLIDVDTFHLGQH